MRSGSTIGEWGVAVENRFSGVIRGKDPLMFMSRKEASKEGKA